MVCKYEEPRERAAFGSYINDMRESQGPRANNLKTTSGRSKERHNGVMLQYNVRECYGFIHNPDLKAKYDSDVYVHKNVYARVHPPLKEGDEVEFSVHLNANNKPQAFDLRRAGRGRLAIRGG